MEVWRKDREGFERDDVQRERQIEDGWMRERERVIQTLKTRKRGERGGKMKERETDGERERSTEGDR